MVRSSVAGLLALTLFGVGATTSTAAEVVVRTVDGKRLTAAGASIESGDALRLTGSTPDRIALADVVSLEFATPGERAPDAWEVTLVDGSRVVGALAAADEDEVALTTAAFGALRLPLDLVRSIGRGGASAPEPAADAELDLVLRKGGDALRGTVTSMGSSGVRIDGDLGAVTLAQADVESIVIAHVDEPPAFTRTRPVALVAVGGSEVNADLRALDRTKVTVATLFAKELAVRVDDVVALRLGAARAEYLSDLTPTRVEQTPYFGGPDDFLFPWQRDRSVTGGPLIAGGRTFTKGLGLHARTRLTYALEGRFERLEAVVGVSDEVLALDAKGSIEVRILVDGAAAWTSPVLRGGDAAVEVPSIALGSARELTIEVDFADAADAADRAIIGDALLVKK